MIGRKKDDIGKKDKFDRHLNLIKERRIRGKDHDDEDNLRE